MKFLNKKGITFPLENLVALILSIIVLFFLLQVISIFFYQEDFNLDVAKDNSISIVDFVDYFSNSNFNDNSYLAYKDCFFLLKLNQLENFQVQNSKDEIYYNYITQNGVGTINQKELLKIKESTPIKSIRNKNFINFKKPVKIIRDSTDESLFANIDLFFGLISFGGMNPFKIDPRPFSYVFLSQKENIVGRGFDNSNTVKGSMFLTLEEYEKSLSFIGSVFLAISGFDSSEYLKNKEEIKIKLNVNINNFKKGNFDFLGEVKHPSDAYVMQGNFLVFSPEYSGERILFLSGTEYSDIYLKSQICSKKYLKKQSKNDFYKDMNIKDIDYFNFNINIECFFDNNKFNLEWDGGLKCSENLEICNKIDLKIKTMKKYREIFTFDSEEKSLGLSKILEPELKGDLSCGIKKKEKEILDYKDSQKVFFDEIFEELNYNYKGKKLEGENILNLGNEDKIKLTIITDANKNKNILCENRKDNLGYFSITDEGEICDDIIPYDGEAYFYIKGKKWSEVKYYKVKQNVFRKKQSLGDQKLYFLGQEIKDININFEDTQGTAISKCRGWGCLSAITGSSDDIKIISFQIDSSKIEDFFRDKLYIYMTPVQFLNVFTFDSEGLRTELKK